MDVELSQVAIAVNSIADSKGVFELLTGKSASKPVSVASQKVNVSFITLGKTKIELLESIEETSPISNFLNKRGAGVHHIAIKTEKFEQLIEKIRNKGIRLLGEPTIGAEGNRVIFLHPKDTSGVLVELEEK